MTTSLHQLTPAAGSVHKRKRVGRGLGSKGSYSGKGVKGQSARSGVSGLRLKGMRHMMLATPKARGFSGIGPSPAVVNVGDLSVFPEGAIVTLKSLMSHGLVPSSAKKWKVLGNGTIGRKLTLKECLFSKSAKAKIEAAGGSIS